MADKKKSKKGIVPLKLQIPFAMVLGIVFIFLLTSRLRDRRTAQGAPAATEPDEMVTSEVARTDSEHRVAELLDKISRQEPEIERGPLPLLSNDPFARPKRSSIVSEHVQGAQKDDAYGGQSREAFVGALTLRATLIDGDQRFVLINDTLYCENDTIGAFKIVEIRERSAALNDDRGPVLLEMKGDDLL